MTSNDSCRHEEIKVLSHGFEPTFPRNSSHPNLPNGSLSLITTGKVCSQSAHLSVVATVQLLANALTIRNAETVSALARKIEINEFLPSFSIWNPLKV
jgi:hypothetical protein